MILEILSKTNGFGNKKVVIGEGKNKRENKEEDVSSY
jgi:hypothetical protein